MKHPLARVARVGVLILGIGSCQSQPGSSLHPASLPTIEQSAEVGPSYGQGDAAQVDATQTAAAQLDAAHAGAAQGDATQRPDAYVNTGFRPVPTLQPTESGAWVVDPSEPLTLYALGRRSMRSRDGGHTWSALNWPGPARTLLFTQNPTRALYLQVEMGIDEAGEPLPTNLIKSLDEGVTWTPVGSVTQTTGELALVNQSTGPVFLLPAGDSILRSIDEGATWEASVLPPTEWPFVFERPILVSGGAKPVLYVGTVRFDNGFEPLVLVSTDAGATFVVNSVPSAESSSTFPPDLSLDCLGRLYVLSANTVYRSNSAGATWEEVATLDSDVHSLHVMQGASDACSDSVYAYGEDSLWHFDAAGGFTTRALPDSGFMLDLGADRLLLVSTFNLRQRSDDGGRSWWTAGIDLSLRELALSPAQPGLFFVAGGGIVHRSEDYGRSWRPGTPNSGRSLSNLYPDPNDPKIVYASSPYGDDAPWSFVSRDGGATFADWPVPTKDEPEMPVAIASSATGSGRITVVTQHGVYTTSDGGARFSPLLLFPPEQQAMWAAISATEPPAIYVEIYVSDSTGPQLWASVDGGEIWAQRDPGTYVTFLIVDPTDAKWVFASPGVTDDYGGNLRTLDGGETWTRFANPEEPSGLLGVDPRAPHMLYAGLQHLYRSSDQGSSWQALTELPPEVYSFAIDPHEVGARYVLDERGLLYSMVE